MITNYSRPQNLQEALKLLAKPKAYPLGGGTWLNQAHEEDFEVVDLQSLGLNNIQKVGNNLEIEACVTLQQLSEMPECPTALSHAIKLQAGLNIRNAATVAGMLVSCDGRSAFTTVMLALDSKLTLFDDETPFVISLGEFLPLRSRHLITKITIPLNVKTAFESVGRSQFDKPIVCACVAQWASGRTRLTLGGWNKTPVLAMDGTESDGIEAAARNAYHEAADEWASSEYRADVASTLARRCLESTNR